jgi:hypothetical protein
MLSLVDFELFANLTHGGHKTQERKEDINEISTC